MKTLRSERTEIIAAFLLGGLIALIFATPAQSADNAPLDRQALLDRSTHASSSSPRIDVPLLGPSTFRPLDLLPVAGIDCLTSYPPFVNRGILVAQ